MAHRYQKRATPIGQFSFRFPTISYVKLSIASGLRELTRSVLSPALSHAWDAFSRSQVEEPARIWMSLTTPNGSEQVFGPLSKIVSTYLACQNSGGAPLTGTTGGRITIKHDCANPYMVYCMHLSIMKSTAINRALWHDRQSCPLICEREKHASLTSAQVCRHQGCMISSGLNDTH